MNKTDNEKDLRSAGRRLFAILISFLIVLSVFGTAGAAETYNPKNGQPRVILGGYPFGVRLSTDGILVIGTDEFISGGEKCSPAVEAGLKKGDLIFSVNNIEISTSEDLVNQIECSNGLDMKLRLERGDKTVETVVHPRVCDTTGVYTLGIKIKDSAAGIGTVTFVFPDTLEFAGLGHGICDGDTEMLMPMREGNLEEAHIDSIEKGEKGKPGELRGSFLGRTMGTLTANKNVGVFGLVYNRPNGEIVPVAAKSEVRNGPAEIVTTLADGEKKSYSIEISDLNRTEEKTKSFVITVKDRALIETSGGIVQGMSGSPIIQNGKLVGAVTHVLINDPTKGYGIFVENMINEMPKLVK